MTILSPLAPPETSPVGLFKSTKAPSATIAIATIPKTILAFKKSPKVIAALAAV
jgi:hypothetical protein